MRAFAFPAELRRAVLAAMNASAISTAELARLNWRLGIAYAEAVEATLKRHKVKLDLVGCHGQTIYHQAKPAKYAGRNFACTWQTGEAAVIAEALGVPVASNFQAGGHGGRRTRSAACFIARLRAVCRSKAWARAAEYRRHCKPDGHSSAARAQSACWRSIQARATWLLMR